MTAAARRARWAAAVSATLCGAFLLAQRVAPPARVWLFLAPFVAVFAAAGLAELLGRARIPNARRVAWLLLGVGLLWPIVSQTHSQSIRRSGETGVCPEAEEVVRFLQRTFSRRSDAAVPVVARFPVSAPLVYYATRLGFGSEHFAYPTAKSVGSAVVLVTRNYPETVAQVLAEYRLDAWADARCFQPFKTFPSVAIFRMPQGDSSAAASPD